MVDRTQLWERDAARGAVNRVLRMARSGRGAVLFVVAEPGLGKSALLDEAVSLAADFTVAAATCPQGAGWLPFGLLDQLLGAPATTSTGAPPSFPIGVSVSSAEARVHRYVSMFEWLRHATHPLLLAVDDLHWADTDSIELLALASRHLAGLAVAMVATLRPWPPVAFDAARLLAQDGEAAVERLVPLSDEASTALLKEHIGDPGHTDIEELVKFIVAGSAGNPLLLTETATIWRHSQRVVSPGATLAERLLLRFADIGPEALRWARAAAVFGTRFRPSMVTALAGQPADQVTDAIEELSAAGLLRGAPDGAAEFVHPLFRHILYEDTAPAVRQALHAQAFQLVLRSGGDAAQAVPHALCADLHGNPEATAALTTAGRAAFVSGAGTAAVEHFEEALRLGGPAAPSEVQLDLANAYHAVGRLAEARTRTELYLRDDELDAPHRFAGLRLLAQLLMASGDYPAAERRWRESSELAAGFDPSLAVQVLLDAGYWGWMSDGPQAAGRSVGRALALIDQLPPGATATRDDAMAASAFLAFLGGDAEHCSELARSARTMLDCLDSPAARPSAFAWDVVHAHINVAKFAENFVESEHAFHSWEAEARRRGASATSAALRIAHSDTLWRTGRIGEGLALLADTAELVALAPNVAPFLAVAMAHLLRERGALDESAVWDHQLEAAIAPATETDNGGPVYLRLWLALHECRNRLQRGDIDGAVLAAGVAEETACGAGLLEPCVVPWHGAAVDAYVAAGLLDAAERLADSLDLVCRTLPCKAPRAVAAAAHAAVSWRRGRVDAAEALFEEALALNAATPMPLAHAETLIAYGRFLRHTGRVVDARRTLRHALEVLAGTGAGRLQQIATEELTVAGGRRRQRSVGLTPQEQRVVDLAAAGLTNREIGQRLLLSAKTVDHHLTRSYAKLGIHSRRQLILARRTDSEPGPNDRLGRDS